MVTQNSEAAATSERLLTITRIFDAHVVLCFKSGQSANT